LFRIGDTVPGQSDQGVRMPGLSSWAVRRPVIALIAWFIAMVAIVGLSAGLKGTLNDSFDLPDTESKTASTA
jgi:hypothetical protein